MERVLFLDSDTFEQIHVFELEALESVMACACVALDTPNGVSEYFVIGTAVCVPNEAEPSNGRLLLFEVSSGTPSTDATWTDVDVESENMVMEGPDHVRTVEPVCIHMVKGAVFSVVGIRGHLAAGIGSKVRIVLTHVEYLELSLNQRLYCICALIGANIQTNGKYIC